MKIEGQVALVTGGASGLGAETARELARRGAKVAVLDRNGDGARSVAAEIVAKHGAGRGLGVECDITSTDSVVAALAAAAEALGAPRIVMNIAGIGTAKRIIGKDGTPMPLEDFTRVVDVNLVGTFNVIRLAAAQIAKLDPVPDAAGAEGTNERGVIVCTASVAAFDGQVGQEAYAASKGALVSLTLPLARDLAQHGIRVVTIAPGLFLTPLLASLPQEAQDSLAAAIPFPRRLGDPTEFASLVMQMVDNAYLNGEVVRLDASLRMAPK
jgi:NAD(P)-dependent dehydrogenase (short-subunit alcohol dehydrogenase family)